LFFDPVFHLATGAVEIFVEGACIDLLGFHRGDDKAGISPLGQVLGLAHHPPFTGPSVARSINKILKYPRRLLRCLMELLGLGHLGL